MRAIRPRRRARIAGHERQREVQRPPQVHVEDLVDVVGGLGVAARQRTGGDPRVGDDGIDGMFGIEGDEPRRDRRPVTHVERGDHCRRSRRAARGRRLVQPPDVAPDQAEMRARPVRKPSRQSRADAAGGS